MTNTSAQINWNEWTEVKESSLENIIYSIDEGTRGNVDITIKCVSPGPNGWKFDEFVEVLYDHFTTYVLPPHIREETHPSRWFRKARKKAAPNEDFRNDGVISEFLLYLFVEVYLDAPLAAHRLYRLDSRNQEKKGSDGIFVGRHGTDECLYVGEAKFYESISSAIEDAFSSIAEFHTKGVNEKMERELDIAGTDFAEKMDSLTTPQLEELSERLGPRAHNNYKIVHPLFLGHETARLSWLPNLGSNVIDWDSDVSKEQQAKNKLQSKISEISYFEKVDDKASFLKKAQGNVELVLFPFPVPNKTEFKKLLYDGMFNPENV